MRATEDSQPNPMHANPEGNFLRSMPGKLQGSSVKNTGKKYIFYTLVCIRYNGNLE
jgi:hypothetical protein